MVRGLKLEFDCHNSELPPSLVVQPLLNAQEKEVTESKIQILSEKKGNFSLYPRVPPVHFTWERRITRNIFLSMAHIPGCQNIAADAESRAVNLDVKWRLDSTVLKQALTVLQTESCIELFASRVNHQLPCYVAYQPDPQAHAIDAFSFSWTGLTFYAFPPFSFCGCVLKKIQQDGWSGVIVAPCWVTQAWWPVLMSLLTAEPVPQGGKGVDLLSLPSQPDKKHPLLVNKMLKLMACAVSGGVTRKKGIQRKQPL